MSKLENSKEQEPDNQERVPLSGQTPVDSEEHTESDEQHEEHGEDQILKRMAEMEKQANQYKDQFLRKAAEFENYRRRTESETANYVRFANEDLLVTVLPIVDDIERSLKSAREHNDNAALFKGLELILQKLMKVLEQNGVKPFESVGKEFDVTYHDALLQIKREDVPPHTVVEEVERGYMLHDRVLRHAKVIVSIDDRTSGATPHSADESTSTSKAG